MKLHYLISFFKSYKPTFFLSLCLLLEMSISQPLLAQTQTFNPTYEMSSEGNIQTFTVPTGVTSLTITAKGSVGGGTSGGKGATMKATFAVTPGALLKIVVGAKGHSSTNDAKYGGGGGGSFVAVGDINAANLLIAAGGGGGGGLTPGGDASTTAGSGDGGAAGNGMVGGGGGGAGINGYGEDAGLDNPCCGGFILSGGGDRNGGAVGGFGGGGGASRGGGGGGGYSGGAGGNESENAGGGGGSSYTKSSAAGVSASVNNTGVGQVIIEWTAPIPTDRFVTTWVNTTGPMLRLFFNALTTGSVNYSYTTNLGKSGGGTFTSASINIGLEISLGNTIAANEVVTLVMEPSNLKQVQLGTVGNTPSGARLLLTGVTQWGSTAWVSMETAFRYCENLNITATDVPNLSSVSSMREMFDGCNKLNGPASIGSWNTTSVTDMSNMFANANLFNQNIGSWNTANVTNMKYMFSSAAAFNQNIGNWNTANVTDMSGMFSNAGTFNQPIGAWNTANVTNMGNMFIGATSFNQDIGYNATTGAWNTGNVTNMNTMFFNATAFNQNIGNWNTAKVTDMSSMFRLAAAFNQNIGSWDVSNVTTMNSMFASATAFNQNIGSWNTAKVTDMGGMFESATAFNQNIGTWNTAAVTNMSSMFRSATVFNQDIGYNATTGAWNTGKVTNMSNMFQSATAFNQPIGTWNTGAVTNMSNMFNGATAFNQPIGSWNTAAVTNMSNMFNGATAFNQAVGTWNVSKVTNMRSIFSGASAFNQNIGTWTLAPTADVRNLLDNSGMDCQNYSATLVGWANNPATPNGRTIGASGRQYGTDAVAARTLLDIDKTWNFSGDASSGMACLPTPTLSSIANQATCDGQTISNIAITLGVDLEAVLSASDDNTNLNPTYTFGGTGANRTLTIATVAGQAGATTVTVTAMGSFGTSTIRTFLLEVGNKVAGPPTLSDFATLNKVIFLAKGNGDQIVATSFDDKLVRTINSDGSTATTYTNSGLVTGVAKNPSFSSTFFNDLQAKKTVGLNSLNQLNDLVVGLGNPQGLHISNGKLYIADFGSNKVIEFNLTTYTSSDFITTIQAPGDITSDASGNMYITDNVSNKIVKRSPDGTLTDYVTISGIQVLKGLATDAAGNLYFSSTANDRIYKVPAGGGTPILYVSSGLSSPIGLLIVNDDLYSANYASGKIIKITPGPATYETCNAKPVFNPTTLANRTLCVSPTQVSLPNTSITVTDPDGSIASTVVTSSNPSLIVATNAGTASAVQLSLTQQANQSGTATISIESTDDRGAKSTLQFEVRVNAIQLTNTTVTDVLCYGNSTGALTVTPTGGSAPYSYVWTKGGSPVGTNSPTITAQSAGVYNVTVTDQFGCSANRNLTINQPAAALTLTKESTNISCYGLNNGTASVTPSGGTGPYRYDWRDLGASPVSTNQSVSNLMPGFYRVTVYDINNCSTEATFNLTQPAEIVISNNPSDAVVCQGADAILTSGATGGTLTYQWYRLTIANGETVALTNGASYQNVTTTALTIRGSVADNGLYRYFMRASQSASCFKNSGNATVTVNPVPNSIATPPAQTICSAGIIPPIILSSNISGTTYTWTRDNTDKVTGLSASGSGGTISGSLTNTTNAPVTVTFTITPTAPVSNCPGIPTTATVTVDPVTIGGSIAGSATVCSGTNSTALTLSNQVGAIQKWQSSLTSDFAVVTDIANMTTSITATNLTQTTYYRAVVQSGACSPAFSATATVTVNPLPTATISGTTTVCQNATSPSVTFTGAGGTAPYMFTYKIGDGAPQMVETSSGNSVTVSVPTTTAGAFTYTLVSVSESSSTSCSQLQSGSAVVTVQGKPTISLSTLQQTLNEGSSQTFCDTDANPNNSLQFNVSGLCVVGSPVWRVQVGSGAWSAWSTSQPVSQLSNNQPHRYQAACDANCPITYTSPIELTINYRSTVPQNVSLLVDGVTVAVGETKEVCSLANNTIIFNANCAAGEVILYSVDGGGYSSGVPTGLVDNQYHNYRVRCRKSDGTPSCVESESGVMRLKLVAIPNAPTVSLSSSTSCDATASFSGQSSCGSLRTVWYNATTNMVLPNLPTTVPSATTSYYARCQTENGCVSERSNVVTFTPTSTQAAPVITVSQEIVCTGTTVRVSANCPAGSQVSWNTGVTTPSFEVAFNNVTKQTYWAKCVFAGGCQSAESARKDIYWNAFVVTLINVGQTKSAIKTNDRSAWLSQFITRDGGPELEQSTQQNPTLYYVENVNKVAPRYWTINVEACGLGTNGSMTFDLLATPEMGVIRSFNTHENNAPYFMYANREGWTELYGQNHPAYGFYQDNGAGSNVYDSGLPKGLYKLGIRYWDMKGWGSIFPSTRKPQGNVLAYQEYWFRIQSKDGVGVGAARTAASGEQERSEGQMATNLSLIPPLGARGLVVLPNPVTNILRLQVQDKKGELVQTTLTDASGRSVLSRHFTPESNSHLEEFEVSELASGMYFLRVNAAGKQQVLKVVKVK